MRNFFVGAGFNSVGIASRRRRRSRPGRVDRRRRGDAWTSPASTSAGSRRFNGNNRWLHDRVAEVLGLHYEIPWPNREMRTARPFRRSPLYRAPRRGQRELRQQDGLGARQLLRPRGRDAGASSTPGASRTGCPGPPPSTPTPARTSRSSTRRRSRSTGSIGPDAEARPAVAVHRGRRRAGRAHRLHRACSTTAAPTSPTSPSPGSRDDEYLIVSSAATTERDKDHIRRHDSATVAPPWST